MYNKKKVHYQNKANPTKPGPARILLITHHHFCCVKYLHVKRVEGIFFKLPLPVKGSQDHFIYIFQPMISPPFPPPPNPFPSFPLNPTNSPHQSSTHAPLYSFSCMRGMAQLYMAALAARFSCRGFVNSRTFTPNKNFGGKRCDSVEEGFMEDDVFMCGWGRGWKREKGGEMGRAWLWCATHFLRELVENRGGLAS